LTPPETPALTEPLPLDRIGTRTIVVEIDADAEARAALAERFGLLDLESFTAKAGIRRRRDTGWIELRGQLKASVVQACVVSLEPVSSQVEAEIDELFDDNPAGDAVEIDLDPLAEDPEPLDGGALDVGEVIAQTLSLAIDPYPRAPGADLETLNETGEVGRETSEDSPFAALAALKGAAVKKQ
jgi:uncharacterized metal-binding protein YceD (DUF177 family)